MKQLFVSTLAAIFILPVAYGQNSDNIRPSGLGVSFALYDHLTPQRIKTSSVSSVLSTHSWAKGDELSPAIGIHYFKGLKKHIDFAANLNASFLHEPVISSLYLSGDKLLLQLEATGNFKMTSDNYWVQPFLTAGIGGQLYHIYYGAYIPLGVGLNINFFDEGRLFFNSTYRVPITTNTVSYHFMHAFGISSNIGKKKGQ